MEIWESMCIVVVVMVGSCDAVFVDGVSTDDVINESDGGKLELPQLSDFERVGLATRDESCCENDKTSTSEIYNTVEEILENLKKRLQEEKPKYKPLDTYEEELYQKSKLIIDNRKPAQQEIIQAYIIYCIRKEEDNEYNKKSGNINIISSRPYSTISILLQQI
ncbi:hypothetical protein C2G38_2205485 [Gigaspora rosea]|uniref:Uncharacterized protein n=1 Tax=Gigaspora rosea TaxID=44941 RepID=A0A397UU10_9GLOM|nr:hypothetical protein C2G38_2205485 [Gigaspora rosea]